MKSKKELYRQHVQKYPNSHIGYKAFCKRVYEGWKEQEAIDMERTPGCYPDRKIRKIEKIGVDTARDGGDNTAIVTHLHHLEEIRAEIKRIRIYIKRTGTLGGVLFLMYILYRTVRLFAYLFYGL